MVCVVSQFRIANGMEAEVRQAFLDRPGLVDDAPGFLGMDVLVDRQDASVFHLLTRWTDEASFRNWHHGPTHKQAHQGMPKGLKLDASHTVLRTFDVLPLESRRPGSPRSGGLFTELPRLLTHSLSLHWLSAARDGRIIGANPAFEILLEESNGSLIGQSLWDRMTEPDAASLQSIVESERRGSSDPILLNFVDRHDTVHTLQCHIDVAEETLVLLGEVRQDQESALSHELMELNNRWALLVRENERNTKALRRTAEELNQALKELNETHWHLRKIQETLPICMYCGKVETAEARWEEVVEYLKKNSLFLTHGCCPNCVGRMRGDSDL